MSQRPNVSDEEMSDYMDFDAVLNKRNAIANVGRNTSLVKKGIVISIAAVVLLALVWKFAPGRQTENPVAEVKPVVPEEKSNAVPRDTNTVVKPDATVVAQTPLKKKTEALKTPVPNNDVKESSTSADSYIQAEPVNGYAELYTYLNTNLVYPKAVLKDSIEGVMTIAFVVSRDGKPENIRVVNSLGQAFDHEAKRLIESMPAWKPAKLNGKPVPSKVSLPLTFQIQRLRVH